MLGYLYGIRFGSKIASANRKVGERLGAGPSRETACGCYVLERKLTDTGVLISP